MCKWCGQPSGQARISDLWSGKPVGSIIPVLMWILHHFRIWWSLTKAQRFYRVSNENHKGMVHPQIKSHQKSTFKHPRVILNLYDWLSFFKSVNQKWVLQKYTDKMNLHVYWPKILQNDNISLWAAKTIFIGICGRITQHSHHHYCQWDYKMFLILFIFDKDGEKTVNLHCQDCVSLEEFSFWGKLSL